MVTYDRYDIVFQEIPNETTLAFTLEGCPNNCVGCHSPHLREQNGTELTKEELIRVLNLYEGKITCVLFLGGDAFHKELKELFLTVKQCLLKSAFYSGDDEIDSNLIGLVNYYKVGSYNKELGGLKSKNTNQRLYKIEDITKEFWNENN